MKLEFIAKFITLLAGTVVCIITIVNDMDTTYSLELLLATLVIFYIIGRIAQAVIKKVVDGNRFVKEELTQEDVDLPPLQTSEEADEAKEEQAARSKA